MAKAGLSNIIVGVTGGIAAYKSAYLVRELVKSGFEVRVVMTSSAAEFVTPLTFQALSGHPVHTSLLDQEAEAGMGHIELAKWANLIIVAPASADLIARYNSGMANDLLTTVLLATEAPVVLAPAMNQAMWLNPLTQRNLDNLQQVMQSRLQVWGPAQGEQACGDVGPGRMLEPEDIMQRLNRLLCSVDRSKTEENDSSQLAGKKVVITAGPTREPIDPVRYISNYSSGKMGYSLARAFADKGAKVVLVSGPVAIPAPAHAAVQVQKVGSATDMLECVEKNIEEGCDIFVAAAAVADYRPKDCADHKIKKDNIEMTVELERNPDIVASVAAKGDRPFTVGFAAETDKVIEYARGKLKSKNLDMIVANDVSDPGIGFNSDQNEVTIIWSQGEKILPRGDKADIADQLVSIIIEQYEEH